LRYEFYRNEIVYLHNEGNKLYKQGKYEEAKQYFEKILEMAPEYAEAHASIGNVALVMSEQENAKNFYAAASSIKPELSSQTETSLAYIATTPSRDAARSLSELSHVLDLAKVGNDKALREFIKPIANLEKWVDEHYKSSTIENKRTAEYFQQMIGTKEFASCTRCQLFAGFWLLKAPKPEDLSRVFEVVENTPPGLDSAGLALALGVAYEKAGERVKAMNVYLRYPDDPRILKRLN
jgi:tetratricopeptide (TPR) repeat protein